MSDIALEFNHVWKKFKKGEKYDSLRDLIPAMARRLFSGNHLGRELQEREFWALKDVSFQVKRGEALGIIGPNGAGKSTILKLLSGILRPNKGEIKVNGRLSALIEVSAGFHPDLTGRENIYLNGTILGMRKEEIDKKFDEIVEFSGLEEFIDTPVKRYSSGMYARLGFSVAAHMEPDVLLVDEVLSVGDWAFQRKCVEKMGSFVRNGITIVFISHNLQAVASLCNRTLLINQGSIVANGPTENVVIHYLQNAMLPSKLQEVKPQIWIKEVNVYNQDTQLMGHFKSGENVKIDVEIVSQTYERNLALGIYILDQNYYSVFNTSSERLGYRTFSIRNGEVLRLRFNVCLHLCQGTYYLGAIIKRYDIDKTFDTKFPAATLLLNSDEGVRGVANLYPTFMIGKK